MVADVMVAARTAMVRVGDTVHQVWVGQTTAAADATVVRDHPDMWRELVVDFPADDGEVAPAGEPEGPSARAVRAWARKHDLEVPARGKVPDELVAAYLAAQEEG